MEGDLHLTRAALRELDRIAVEELGLPSSVLMENAGRGAAEALLRELGEPSDGAPSGVAAACEVALICGAGNNAGDGYVTARHLHNAGVGVLLCETRPPDQLAPDAALFRRVTAALGLEHAPLEGPGRWAELEPRLARARIVVDALLGTGARGEPRGALGELIGALNRLCSGGPAGGVPLLVALDLPSGLDADSGRPSRATVRAALTLTFGALKTGFRAPTAAPYLGRIELLGIGVPLQLAARAQASAAP